MSHLVLQRWVSGKYGTPGTLYLADRAQMFPLCCTLEPQQLDNTSGNGIPFGDYNFSVTHSPKFNRLLPLLDVAGRTGIRIHAGNTLDDTTGCILVGIGWTGSSLRYSKLALQFIINVIHDLKINQIKIIC